MDVYTTCTLNPFYRIQFHIVLIHFRHLHHNIVSINEESSATLVLVVTAVVVVVVFGVDIIKIRRNANQMLAARIWLQCGWIFDYYFIAGPCRCGGVSGCSSLLLLFVCVSRKSIQPSVRASIHPCIYPCVFPLRA